MNRAARLHARPPAGRGARPDHPADRGAATAEFAAGLPAVMVLLLAGLTAVGAVTTKLQCVDAAREAARLAARGAPAAAVPPATLARGEVTVTISGDTAVATVQAPVPVLGARLPGLTVDATAVAAVEPGFPPPVTR